MQGKLLAQYLAHNGIKNVSCYFICFYSSLVVNFLVLKFLTDSQEEPWDRFLTTIFPETETLIGHQDPFSACRKVCSHTSLIECPLSFCQAPWSFIHRFQGSELEISVGKLCLCIFSGIIYRIEQEDLENFTNPRIQCYLFFFTLNTFLQKNDLTTLKSI